MSSYSVRAGYSIRYYFIEVLCPWELSDGKDLPLIEQKLLEQIAYLLWAGTTMLEVMASGGEP